MGRTADQVAAALRVQILSGQRAAGEFLPPIRELAAQCQVAPMTIRRALQRLQRDGLVAMEPRQGCRVQPQAGDASRGCPLAHILDYPADAKLTQVHQYINSALRHAAAKRGWSLLGIHAANQSPEAVLALLRKTGAWGVVLDSAEPTRFAYLQQAGLPVIMVDNWAEDAPFDIVEQDNYRGGFLAVRHLLQLGHRRLAWLGPTGETCISRERFAGAMAALTAAGVELPSQCRFFCTDVTAAARAEALLTLPDRPAAILAPWANLSMELTLAAQRLGLKPGRDLDMVGWGIEEMYTEYPGLGEPPWLPPMITWKIGDLCRAALSRLVERRLEPGLSTLRISVGVVLSNRFPDAQREITTKNAKIAKR
jgi:DNA-binding transcriptional regulator YhcF (GntR family)